ncbi:MAG: ABC transporter ATP-binding protein/permease [Deltaproteobacteria bacterium]|nr:ABC transporter ATP-binding protein/permease [Deltaproteobacteria bacterium]
MLSQNENDSIAKAGLFESLFNASTSMPTRLATVVIFVLGYFGLQAGNITTIEIFLHLMYAGIVIIPLTALFEAFSNCYFLRHTFKKIIPFLNLERESKTGIIINDLKIGLNVTNLCFSYPARVDNIIFFEKGSVAEQGNHNTLYVNGTRYYSYLQAASGIKNPPASKAS